MSAAWAVPSLFVLVVIVEGIRLWKEGAFYPGQSREKPVKIPFILHGGVVAGDLFLLPDAFHQWLPQMQVGLWRSVGFFVTALGITWIAHRAW